MPRNDVYLTVETNSGTITIRPSYGIANNQVWMADTTAYISPITYETIITPSYEQFRLIQEQTKAKKIVRNLPEWF